MEEEEQGEKRDERLTLTSSIRPISFRPETNSEIPLVAAATGGSWVTGGRSKECL